MIRYQTGGTFATTHGAWHIVGLSETRKGAEKLIKNALEGFGYKPWEGYFERFEDSEVHVLPIEN